MSLEDKMNILKKLDEGVSQTEVCCLFGVNQLAVLTIKKNKRATGPAWRVCHSFALSCSAFPRDNFY